MKDEEKCLCKACLAFGIHSEYREHVILAKELDDAIANQNAVDEEPSEDMKAYLIQDEEWRTTWKERRELGIKMIDSTYDFDVEIIE